MASATPRADGASDPLTRRYVAWTLRHGRLLWLLAALLAIPAGLRTASLYRNLRSDIEELLPRDAPSVVAVQELPRAHGGPPVPGRRRRGRPARARRTSTRGERLLDDLAARVRQYPRDLVSRVRVGYEAERAFVQRHGAMLLDLADLQTIQQRIEDRVHWEYGQQTDTLLDDNEPAPSVDFSDIERKYSSQVGGPDLEGGRFTNDKLGTTLMLVDVGGFSTSASRAAELIKRVKAEAPPRPSEVPSAMARGCRWASRGTSRSRPKRCPRSSRISRSRSSSWASP